MPPYHELHFFLDESGRLDGQPNRKEVVLVGGVLVFGPYTAADDQALQTRLRERVLNSGGRFPADLHAADQQQASVDRQQLLGALQQDVKAWAEGERAVYGIAIQHQRDQFADAGGLLREAAFDNRYVSLLWALIEHLLFVDDRVASRLGPNVQVHLHLASRQYCFHENEVPRAQLEALGMHVRPDDRRGTGWYRVPCILRPDEVRGMLRIALRRWLHVPLTVDRIEVEPLDYVSGKSPAALYLADLHLGQVRQRQLARIRNFRPAVRTPLLDEFCLLRYEPQLELAARQQAALAAGDLATFLECRAVANGSSSELDQRQLRTAATLLKSQPSVAREVLAAAVQEVDQPGQAAVGWRRADSALRLMRQAGTVTLREEVLECQARLSLANHRGNVAAAAQAWRKFLEWEPQLPQLGVAGLRLKTELRVRRAVGLIDVFAHDDAVQILHEIGAAQDRLQLGLAAEFNVPVTELPSRELGICHGTLGQACAFRGRPGDQTLARDAFRQALRMFTDPRDQERQWVYLGHLACDLSDGGRELWDEVVRAVPELQPRQPVVRAGGQFVLALQLKGVLRFSSTQELGDYLDRWRQNDPLTRYGDEERQEHPFGLIGQALALCHVRAARETGKSTHLQAARQAFDVAFQQLKQGGVLLQVLARVCQLRRALVETEFATDRAAPAERLASVRLDLERFLGQHFGPTAWDQDVTGRAIGYFGGCDPGPDEPADERARSLLGAVRFNYW
ncbi:MAG: hypothetical protein U0935_15265 [Pirellulales bacterium]